MRLDNLVVGLITEPAPEKPASREESFSANRLFGEPFASDKPLSCKSHLVTAPMESSIGFRISASATVYDNATKSRMLRYFSGNILIARKALPSQTQP
jgi:hypothetical protein